ncbi:porin [Candidatus Pelagibacter sp.]|nr:porin [Candidatus Pelagibacter sp.]
MNNLKKIGLSALAGSLVATSAFAGEMSVAGSASINVEHTNGGGGDSGKTFSMGNQLTFSGGGELDNGLSVALSFVIDQGDDATTGVGSGPFDSHSVTVSSDGLGSLKFSGEGGSSALSALDGTAAGDIWDDFDIASTVHPTGLGGGNNSMMYTLPAMVDGVAINASYTPRTTGADASTSYSVTYTGVEGLSVSYGMGDGGNESTDGTAFKMSYAFGPITAGYSTYEHDTTGTASDDETSSYAISYTVSDEISVTYGTEEVQRGTLEDVETMSISAAYTAGGMTLSGSMSEVDNLDGTTDASQDRERWALGLSFAF